MLKKQLMQPGVQLKVKDVIKDGVPASLGGGETKTHLSVFTGMVGGMSGGELPVGSGETLILEKGPRKVDRINLCRVRHIPSQMVGEVYWCELRVSCDMI